jgi:predicted transposase/invertase (TIGR01784 family)
MRFVDIKNDVAFRKIFGNQKKSIVLISFLNAVLDLQGTNRIQKVTILDPNLLPRIAGEKASIIDVRATDQRGRQFVVEMQVADKAGFLKRVQFYTARDYSMQIERGDDYPKLKPTYFIGILDFSIGFGKNYLSKHFTIEEETGMCILADIQHRFIQLPKFKKKKQELETLVDKWTYFIKHADKLEIIPEDTQDNGLLMAYQEAEKYRWTKEELIAYDNVFMREQDERGRLELAVQQAQEEAEKIGIEKGMQKGMEQGMKKGVEKGMEKGISLAILGLHKNGVPISVIAASLSISVEKVQEIIGA